MSIGIGRFHAERNLFWAIEKCSYQEEYKAKYEEAIEKISHLEKTRKNLYQKVEKLEEDIEMYEDTETEKEEIEEDYNKIKKELKSSQEQ
ncbi:MAG: hypothetical protein ACOCUU_02260, partial [Nanoarchaeota archaeon]